MQPSNRAYIGLSSECPSTVGIYSHDFTHYSYSIRSRRQEVSAAAPATSGIFALALQANTSLTWRDMQHHCVETAQPVDDENSWGQLPSGRLYSNEVGFGILSLHAFVEAATGWKTVNSK
ncbi:S8 family serine peptidase, partial [Streptococcus uberis]|uniref:S8 family serine peptidase n=1 Tax=Streptococcus uberis TaxID=1349 RepID=UPI003D6C590A